MVSEDSVDGVRSGVGGGDRLLDGLQDRCRACAQHGAAPCRCQDVAGQEQLNRQQVLQQAQRGVRLADAERRAGGMVFDAEVQPASRDVLGNDGRGTPGTDRGPGRSGPGRGARGRSAPGSDH
jgi:hypothetical protein